MNKIRLSKSRYCRAIQCKKMIWLERYHKDLEAPKDKESVFEIGRKVGDLAKGLFGDYEDVEFDMNLSNMIERTKELLEEGPNVITEASFIYDNNFCSVDILKNDSDGVEIYEVKSSTEVKDIYVEDVAFQCFVLSSLGFNVKKVAIVHINKEYERGHELDLNQLFHIEDMTGMAKGKLDEIMENIASIQSFMDEYGKGNEPSIDIGLHCFNPYSCGFWKHCTRNLPKPNVFDVVGMMKSTKFNKYENGIISFEDLSKDKSIKSLRYIEQIDFELNNRSPKINAEAISKFLEGLRYPMYFLDFETCSWAIPEIEGTKPYSKIPFQYSLHIIEEEGAPLIHKEFLAEREDKDLIRIFAESLVRDIQDDGSVIIYNASFESARIREIEVFCPDLKDDLKRINENMFDLMVPFKNRDYYMKEMRGSASIKEVLPALYPNNPELNYSSLQGVHKGTEASHVFLSLKDKSPEEQEKCRNALLEYCKLDTYAMVKILERFAEIAGYGGFYSSAED